MRNRSTHTAPAFFLSLCALCALCGESLAQLPVPRLNAIFPCGARQGATVECVVTGADLNGATGLYFSHPGITAEPAGAGKFTVTVGKAVPLGPHDVRVVAPLGVSNFRTFVVGDWPEALEKEPNDELAQAQRVGLPVVVNGRIDKPADVDHYAFAAKKGQRVLINCWAWRIDSPLDATLMVYDSKGKELAYNGDTYGKDPFIDFTAPADGEYVVKVWDFVYGGSADHVYRLHIGSLPHLDAAVPAAAAPGKKTLVTFYGRNLPGGKPAPAGMKIQGRPLEVITREIEGPAETKAEALRAGEAIRPPRAALEGIDYRLSTPDGSSNPLFLGLATEPILVEREPNNDVKSAQEVPIGCDLTGTLAPAGDLDYYRFAARKGEKVVVEVIGERQSGLVDPFLAAFDSKGKRLAALDDTGANIGQLRFTTTTRDPRWDFTAPAAGNYLVCVRDLYHQQRGEPHFIYRLIVRRPQPDFRLVVVPAHDVQPDATVVGRGSKQRMDVLAFRKDGFDGPIRVEASGLPTGVTCPTVVIGPGKTSAPLVFEATKDAPAGHGEIQVIGSSRIDGHEVVHRARGGGLTWPTVNTPGIARMAHSIVLSVRDAAPFSVSVEPTRATAAPGSKVVLKARIRRAADWSGPVQLSGFDLPNGAAVGLVTAGKDAAEARLELTLPARMRPGTYTFAINGAGQVPRDYAQKRPAKKPGNGNVRAVYPSEAVTVTVGEP
jgi:hypothetical protein